MITTIDFRILGFIQEKMRCKALDCIMPKISMLGNFGIIWIICVIMLISSNKYEDTGEQITIGLIVGILLGNVLLKHIFARPRPCWVDRDKQLLIKEPKDYSFPSGHTLSSVISASVLIHTNLLLGMIALAICLLILFSRMYLFVHYPSDIFGGALLGIIIAEVVLKLCI